MGNRRASTSQEKRLAARDQLDASICGPPLGVRKEKAHA